MSWKNDTFSGPQLLLCKMGIIKLLPSRTVGSQELDHVKVLCINKIMRTDQVPKGFPKEAIETHTQKPLYHDSV